MRTVVLENEEMRVEISPRGAELTSIFSKKHSIEFLWQADRRYWERHAPVLFPIVGKLKEDKYTYKGSTYHMSQHGFARDKIFHIEKEEKNMSRFVLISDSETLISYPFKFEFIIEYKLAGRNLSVAYIVKNLEENETMYFSVGAHPGFNVPLDTVSAFDDYTLSFDREKVRMVIPVTQEVLLDMDQATSKQIKEISLTRDLFKQGVIIMETVGETRLILQSEKSDRKIELAYQEMPFLGIWSPYPDAASFVCIEPWCGVADIKEANGELSQKYGGNSLLPMNIFETSYSMSFS